MEQSAGRDPLFRPFVARPFIELELSASVVPELLRGLQAPHDLCPKIMLEVTNRNARTRGRHGLAHGRIIDRFRAPSENGFEAGAFSATLTHPSGSDSCCAIATCAPNSAPL